MALPVTGPWSSLIEAPMLVLAMVSLDSLDGTSAALSVYSTSAPTVPVTCSADVLALHASNDANRAALQQLDLVGHVANDISLIIPAYRQNALSGTVITSPGISRTFVVMSPFSSISLSRMS